MTLLVLKSLCGFDIESIILQQTASLMLLPVLPLHLLQVFFLWKHGSLFKALETVTLSWNLSLLFLWIEEIKVEGYIFGRFAINIEILSDLHHFRKRKGLLPNSEFLHLGIFFQYLASFSHRWVVMFLIIQVECYLILIIQVSFLPLLILRESFRLFLPRLVDQRTSDMSLIHRFILNINFIRASHDSFHFFLSFTSLTDRFKMRW